MSQIQSSMRLMEFLVEEVHTISGNLTNSDHTCVTFTYLDYFKIHVNESEYESSWNTKSKNCLFTTNQYIPADKNQVNMDVFKLPFNEEMKTLRIGGNTINLDKIFTNSFQAISMCKSTTAIQVEDATTIVYPFIESTCLTLPILDDASKIVGSVRVHIMLTTFGPSLIFQSPCLAMSKTQAAPACMASCAYGPMNTSEDLQMTALQSNHIDDVVYPLVPPASKDNIEAPEHDVEEFCAEVNDNVLIVRVVKSNRKVTRVCDEIDACAKHCNIENTNMFFNNGNSVIVDVPSAHAKCCDLTEVKGTLKYPMNCCATSKPRTSNPDEVVCNIAKPSDVCLPCRKLELDGPNGVDSAAGVEVCKKGSKNPNCDVFVVKLGNVHGTSNEIELELRTPKSPTAQMPVLTQTAQTYEEDFNEVYNGNQPGKFAKGKRKSSISSSK